MISCRLICGQLVIHLQFGYHSSIGCCKTIVTIDRFAKKGGAGVEQKQPGHSPKAQKIQDRIILGTIWVVSALVIALVVGTVMNYIWMFK